MEKMSKLKFRTLSVSQRIVYIVAFIITTALTLSHLSVPVFAVIQGLKTHEEVVLTPFAWPTAWHFENYLEVFTLLQVGDTNFLGMTFNTLWYSIGSTFATVAGTFCVTYIVSKYKFPGCSALNIVAILVMIIPLASGSSAYKTIYTLGLNDSPLFLITKIGGLTGPYLLMKACIDGISWTYAEAAFLDGASDFQVMHKIILPQLVAPIMAIVVNNLLVYWNSFEEPLLYLSELPMLSVGIKFFQNEMIYNVRMDILFAACVISAIPLWVLYGLCNKTLLNVSFGGGLKG